MSRLEHLTDQRKQFVEAYYRLCYSTHAAREARYKDSPSLVNQASKLKRDQSIPVERIPSLLSLANQMNA